jgi:hypothetical protein
MQLNEADENTLLPLFVSRRRASRVINLPSQLMETQVTNTDCGTTMNKSEFKVIIVGGSIAGLTLAHCLDRLGIEHIVLEKGSDPAPQLGASIGILPNGARVLDQLQLYSEVEQYTEPLNTATIRFSDGFSFDSIYPKLIHQRWALSLLASHFFLLHSPQCVEL